MDAPQASRKASRPDRDLHRQCRRFGIGGCPRHRALRLDRPIRSREKTRERGPGYRVLADGADLVVAWKATRQDKNASFGKAADISFGEPVNAAPVVIDGAHTLARSRSAAKAD